MKNILILAALFAASIANAQTKAVLKNINGGTITESLTIGSGKTLTIASGATINATGATITGFTAAASWGAITGTLSAQTDLQSALDLKAPLESPAFTGTATFAGSALGTAAFANYGTDEFQVLRWAASSNSADPTSILTSTALGAVKRNVTMLPVNLGGTNASTAAGAANNILPAQTDHANHVLLSDGTNVFWDLISLGTSVQGFLPGTSFPALEGDVTTAAGSLTTTIATGAVGATQMASTAVTPGSYTSTNLTVDADGRITAASNGSSGITIGTTTSNGTAGRVLYTDGTNVQAYTITGTGSVMMSASPTSTGTATFGAVATNNITGVTQPTTTMSVGGNSNYPYATEFGSFAGHVLTIGKNAGASSSSGILMRSDYGIYFSSGTNPAISAVDVGYERSAAGVLKIVAGPGGALRDMSVRIAQLTDYIEGTEMTAPSAPAANKGRIYFEDNGAGKTRLMVIFPSGAAQQIAIEP